MKVRWLIVICLLVSQLANAADIWKIPQLNETNELPQPRMRTNLPNDLVVDHPLILVTVPKMWSVGVGRDLNLKVEGITIGPNANLADCSTCLNINRRFQKTNQGIEEITRAFQGHRGRKVERRRFNGIEWAYVTENVMENNKLTRRLLAGAVKDGNQWVVTGAAPASENATYIPQYDTILSSMKLK